MTLPNDPIMLMSFVNTQLRDHYSSLEDLAGAFGTTGEAIEEKLSKAGFHYQKELNQFRA
ncbi:MAG: DUF4250 domain-containing protein [Lachnospiraceae bacterium]|nr:DUF4250 domain-containing protein [Lachnospiraceae bacterium]